MFCPNCGKKTNSNFCPDCGYDLRNITVSKPVSGSKSNPYTAYLRFYPNKMEAIRVLRIETGMNLAEAKKVIDGLFGTEIQPALTKIKNNSSPATTHQNSKTSNLIEVDVAYYANKYYPDKAKAVTALLQLGVSPVDARNAIDDAFLELDGYTNARKAEQQKKVRNIAKAAGKGIGMTAFAAGAIGLRVVSKLVKPYSKKRR